ncbi:MAG: HAMP domain-containing histidine kinase [Alphaproteobacteria bacterium]|nr:HAMP domain-containing histidine kinase [Alphaproteobacteria bacterium]
MLFNYAQRAHKSGERLLILINNLLDMSKFEKGAVQLERKELLFSDLIQTVIAETSGVVEVKHEKLVFQPMANEPLVEVDEGRMAQVMTNLIGNAVKYSEKGTIRISQSVNPEAIFLEGVAQAPGMIISISDEGIGIPEDELVKIFDKFFESSLTKTKAGGTGLGLAISREIVKAHLGTIWAENNKNGIGSTFTFMFPLKEIPGVTQATEKYA